MHIRGIGELANGGQVWRLTYADCRHQQEFAGDWLQDDDQAARVVRKHYARCLMCGLLDAKRRRGSQDAASDSQDAASDSVTII